MIKQNKKDKLSMLYPKAAKRQDMNFHEYCKYVHTLNTEQHQIVMSMVQKLYKCTKRWRKRRRIQNFSEWSRRDKGKSHCMSHTKRYVQIFQTHSKT